MSTRHKCKRFAEVLGCEITFERDFGLYFVNAPAIVIENEWHDVWDGDHYAAGWLEVWEHLREYRTYIIGRDGEALTVAFKHAIAEGWQFIPREFPYLADRLNDLGVSDFVCHLMRNAGRRNLIGFPCSLIGLGSMCEIYAYYTKRILA